jgi:hypothetical protein
VEIGEAFNGNNRKRKDAQGQDLLYRPARRQNGEPQASEAEHIGAKCPPQTVILSAREFCFEIEAILASLGFDPFCPLLRWQASEYRHIPVACRLALNKMASNLDDLFNRS